MRVCANLACYPGGNRPFSKCHYHPAHNMDWHDGVGFTAGDGRRISGTTGIKASSAGLWVRLNASAHAVLAEMLRPSVLSSVALVRFNLSTKVQDHSTPDDRRGDRREAKNIYAPLL